MLEITDVELIYPDGDSETVALRRVSLRVNAGEMVAITGASGSGKSSLLAVAATLQRPNRGRVTIAGVDTTGMNGAELAKLRRDKLGIIFQAPNLIPSLTVAEQLEIASELRGTTRGRAQRNAVSKRVAELLSAVDMADHAKKRPGELSGGQRQRVNIARALMNSPRVLLVDEPTSALDSVRSEAVMALLKQLTVDFNLATVVVTHDREQLHWCDSEYVMSDGVLTRARG
ncbi:ABC transporter ATP-binding protein [Leucobacter sp. OH1287]|uniref:ABC transporter ATP-binding protein n=1 Tax=Leucobacter sp. OH1287 TaxID=2491049 RepID=UPI000F5F5B3D|nr:ABC transporter ATP-binding protein [Leucobacter sp. OH1287]RRD61165.1 ABC transporter ATP-binding protein [Leucobacter sp. OH1287]